MDVGGESVGSVGAGGCVAVVWGPIRETCSCMAVSFWFFRWQTTTETTDLTCCAMTLKELSVCSTTREVSWPFHCNS